MSRWSKLVLSGLMMMMVLGCRGNPATVLSRLEESRRSVARLRLDFSQVADASNRAVMADTEGDSSAVARESKVATTAVEGEAATLKQLLSGLNFKEEARILSEFNARFAEYRVLDGRIVELAVENTNLKAQALSFGPANDAVGALENSLNAARSSFQPKDLERAELLVAQTLLSVRETQVLQAPHIAERQEERMASMEKQMTDLDAKARAALSSLRGIAPPDAQPALADALSALDRFKAVSARIVELSRRNTHVMSLDLSLRKKPALVAACSERLVALQDALALEGPKSTR
ncbi:MAG TPA: hypothetical protein VHM25_20090 [Polyangiaceae bacterium]|nr:hypothetical protein [Polyangiaceae bacterium]